MSSLTASLSNIPLSAWENETPVLDALIRETLRVAEPHVAMRQYLPLSQSHAADKELYLGGRQIPRGAYVMYPFSDVHLSSEIYKDPWRWDPARKEMDLKAPYSYVGMGAGTCRVHCSAPIPVAGPRTPPSARARGRVARARRSF